MLNIENATILAQTHCNLEKFWNDLNTKELGVDDSELNIVNRGCQKTRPAYYNKTYPECLVVNLHVILAVLYYSNTG